MRVAYQGAPGAFSHEACLEALPGCQPVAFDSFAAAVRAVQDGGCDRAVLPAENTTAGRVPEVAELIAASGLRSVGEHWLRVRLQLLGVPGAELGRMRTAESHAMALAQCGRVLAELCLRPIEVFDTAGAAQAIAAAGDPARGAVASRTAAALYGLQVLRENIEDTDRNRTRFLLLARG